VATAKDIALSRLSAVLAEGNHPPSFLVPIYKAAARRYHVPWSILAAINAVETDYGRDLSTSSAGAEGWMQFLPGTWAKYALTRQADPDDPRDAIFAAARYLKASGGTGHLRRAIFAYNHATWYVDEVEWLSDEISAQQHTTHGQRAKLTLMLSTARLLNGLPYIYGGGHSGWTLTTGYDCSGFVSAVLHAAGYLTEPVTTQSLPSQPGIERGPGKWVTIFDRTDAGSLTQDHVIVEINGQWWESGGSSTTGGGASVHRVRSISPSYLATFNLILHPRAL
jgi:hypothetical protein